MDEFTASLIKQFNCKPKYIKKLKYMYICFTDKGNMLIKPVSNSIENIIFINNVKLHLKQNGFKNIDFYYSANNGLPYVINENITYVMTDYFDFRECDFSNQDDILNSIKCLANFHKFSQNSTTNLNDSQIKFIDIKAYFQSKLQIFNKIKKTVSKQKNILDFDLHFIKNYNYFYENACKSLEILEKFNYASLNKIACKNVMICHNKLKEESILFSQNSTFLTNMEFLSVDHFIKDIYKFLLRYIKKHSCCNLSLEKILCEYDEINSIDSNILPILYAMLLFPEKYIDLCQSFYEKKRSFTPISISSQMENILSSKQYHMDFISDIKFN